MGEELEALERKARSVLRRRREALAQGRAPDVLEVARARGQYP